MAPCSPNLSQFCLTIPSFRPFLPPGGLSGERLKAIFQENPDLADSLCFGTSTIPRIWDPFRKMRVEKLVSLNQFSEQMVYYASSYAIFRLKTLSGATFESGERQRTIFREYSPLLYIFHRYSQNGLKTISFV